MPRCLRAAARRIPILHVTNAWVQSQLAAARAEGRALNLNGRRIRVIDQRCGISIEPSSKEALMHGYRVEGITMPVSKGAEG